jgi:hypothetical protein
MLIDPTRTMATATCLLYTITTNYSRVDLNDISSIQPISSQLVVVYASHAGCLVVIAVQVLHVKFSKQEVVEIIL